MTQGPSLVAQTIKNLPTMQKTWVGFLGWEDPLDKEMATHSSVLDGEALDGGAWRATRVGPNSTLLLHTPPRPQEPDPRTGRSLNSLPNTHSGLCLKCTRAPVATANSGNEACLGWDQVSHSPSPAAGSDSCICHCRPIPASFPGPCPPRSLRRVSPCPSGSEISGDTESKGKVKLIWRIKRREREPRGWRQSWGNWGGLGVPGWRAPGEKRAWEGLPGLWIGSPWTSWRGTRKEWNPILMSFWPLICESLNGTDPILGPAHVGPRLQWVPGARGESPKAEAATWPRVAFKQPRQKGESEGGTWAVSPLPPRLKHSPVHILLQAAERVVFPATLSSR